MNSKHLASKGGRKSKRTLTKEQAQEMVRKREEGRRADRKEKA